MKIFYLVVSLIFTMSLSYAQNDYYWYKGQKVPVKTNSKKKFVLLKEEKANEKSALSASGVKIKKSWNNELPGTLQPFKNKKPKVRASAIIESEKQIEKLSDEQVTYEAPFLVNEDGEEAPLTNLFYVKLKRAGDVKKLEKLAAKHTIDILGNNVFMPLWYTLSAENSTSGNALTLANKFFESGQFAASEPEILIEIKQTCANDENFSSQWGFNNTGQYTNTPGIDANICEAWNYTQGSSNITVAVIDDGVQLDHPDLTNMHPVSFDGHTGTSPSVVRGYHGTQVAGIVGAEANNSIGVAGVAPNSRLMSLSLSFEDGAASSPAKFADAINFAWQNGADVINNSWSYSTWQMYILDDAIENALNNGRNGLGTVVVFASGNDDAGVIDQPARNNPETIVVGSIGMCGERKSLSSCDGKRGWGSNYGNELDVVAPGVHIPTTFRDSKYTKFFGGTSSAAPHVAGLAALILSLDPGLTQQEVADIIEQTAQKVWNYNYTTASGRPNGTWYNEVGYGLIDAEEAVKAVGSQDLRTTYNVPRSSAIPAGFKQYSHVHTIGRGGPDMSNVFNSVFNWQGSSYQPNALYQFTLETNNGSPRYYTNITDHAHYTLHKSSPEINIYSSIGFAGLDGSYWVTLDGNNLVLVEKSGDYALYFSNSSTPPSPSSSRLALSGFDNTGTHSIEKKTVVHPNPFASEATLTIPEELGEATVIVTNVQGKTIESFKAKGNVAFGGNYEQGIYTVKMIGTGMVKQASFVKKY